MRRLLFVVLWAIPAGIAHAQLAQDSFTLAAPSQGEMQGSKSIYSTYYHVWPGKDISGGVPLLLKNGQLSEEKISRRDWCYGAMEGTIVIKKSNGTQTTFNFADKSGPYQVNCKPYFPSVKEHVITGMAKTRYLSVGANAPYGLGVGGYRLVPYRTIAVDPNVFPYGTLLYVPALRGQSFKDDLGQQRVHDGYLYAADKGGLIKGNHVDFFAGTEKTNPFPSVIKSAPSGTFEAMIVNNKAAKDFLAAQHKYP